MPGEQGHSAKGWPWALGFERGEEWSKRPLDGEGRPEATGWVLRGMEAGQKRFLKLGGGAQETRFGEDPSPGGEAGERRRPKAHWHFCKEGFTM